ncbi:hypothetical protein NQ317_008187 [Molorchus minor]|uniref:Tyr recombinase domain-containing protein n=1 Tax=Molorchus minor TaxID=1323400 RepID=A0ABQ9JJQ8_9CUCU|nr:hypothetical protein NQ317_008187 [Molorchus minor]
MGKAIEKCLGLPNPKKFTGHCLRRSSATLYADAGAPMTELKRHGGFCCRRYFMNAFEWPIPGKSCQYRTISPSDQFRTAILAVLCEMPSASSGPIKVDAAPFLAKKSAMSLPLGQSDLVSKTESRGSLGLDYSEPLGSSIPFLNYSDRNSKRNQMDTAKKIMNQVDPNLLNNIFTFPNCSSITINDSSTILHDNSPIINNCYNLKVSSAPSTLNFTDCSNIIFNQ